MPLLTFPVYSLVHVCRLVSTCLAHSKYLINASIHRNSADHKLQHLESTTMSSLKYRSGHVSTWLEFSSGFTALRRKPPPRHSPSSCCSSPKCPLPPLASSCISFFCPCFPNTPSSFPSLGLCPPAPRSVLPLRSQPKEAHPDHPSGGGSPVPPKSHTQ